MGFKMVQLFAQNPSVLAYGFTENHQLLVKTDRNSLFLGRDPHIPSWLYNMVTYMSFLGLKKNQIFAQNP
jgi:hypothetical protein